MSKIEYGPEPGSDGWWCDGFWPFPLVPRHKLNGAEPWAIANADAILYRVNHWDLLWAECQRLRAELELAEEEARRNLEDVALHGL